MYLTYLLSSKKLSLAEVYITITELLLGGVDTVSVCVCEWFLFPKSLANNSNQHSHILLLWKMIKDSVIQPNVKYCVYKMFYFSYTTVI